MADRDELSVGQVWQDYEGDFLRLDRDVPGDGSAWYADIWIGNHWSHEDHTVQPSDLIKRVTDPETLLSEQRS